MGRLYSYKFPQESRGVQDHEKPCSKEIDFTREFSIKIKHLIKFFIEIKLKKKFYKNFLSHKIKKFFFQFSILKLQLHMIFC